MIAGAAALGLLIGLTLGALGGGGSILTVPMLVFLLRMSPQEATTASLVIVGLTAVAATIAHARSGHTRWGYGVLVAALVRRRHCWARASTGRSTRTCCCSRSPA